VALSVLAAGPGLRVQFVPDDAHYYLTLARHFAVDGQWTFDGGVSVTTGFHPLHAYILAGLFWCAQPSPDGFVTLSLVYSFLLLALPLTMGLRFARRSGRTHCFLLLILFVLSRNVLLNAVSGVEWTWTVTLAACYAALLWQAPQWSLLRTAAALALCGLALAWARTDSGLWPAAVAVAAAAEALFRGNRRFLTPSLAGLAGAITGSVTLAAHNAFISGSLLQSSAQMKIWWGAVSGTSFIPLAQKVTQLFGPDGQLSTVLALALATLALFDAGRRFGSHHTGGSTDAPLEVARERVLWLAGALAVAGYFLLYARSAFAIQNWYTGNLVTPLFMLLSLPLSKQPGRDTVAWLRGLALAGLIVAQLPAAWNLMSRAEWPHQQYMREAGIWLGSNQPAGITGSWNAGIIGYYEGGRVVNLDGLVNNDIYSFAVTNSLPAYLENIGITYVVDYPAMLHDQRFRRRGGYDDAAFVARFQPQQVFDNSPTVWRNLTLFRIIPPSSHTPSASVD